MRYTMENIVNKKVKILEASISAMIGKTATVLYDVGGIDIIVGFPKGKGLGWEHPDFPEYDCRWLLRENIEIISPVTKSKFK